MFYGTTGQDLALAASYGFDLFVMFAEAIFNNIIKIMFDSNNY